MEKGYPFTTENGNIIFDVDFGMIENPKVTQDEINDIAGILDTGIFINEGDVFYRANRDNSVQVFEV
jgi:ribose 5-phosphate isomerase A